MLHLLFTTGQQLPASLLFILPGAGVHRYAHAWAVRMCAKAFHASLSAHLPEEHAGTHTSPVWLLPWAISTPPHQLALPTSPFQTIALSPYLHSHPISLEQRVQTGQPSRSLSKAAEYSSSLGVSPPPLRPGLGPFNKEQVIQMETGWEGQTPWGGW